MRFLLPFLFCSGILTTSVFAIFQPSTVGLLEHGPGNFTREGRFAEQETVGGGSSNATREGRMFSFFSSFKNSNNDDTCGDGSNTGFCTSLFKCKTKGGSASSPARCSNNNVCCQITAKCSSTERCIIRSSGTTVQQVSGATNYRRTYRYRKPKGICQMRLDFDEFMLEGPTLNGDCSTDVYQVAGLQICGSNKGQHVYVDFDESSKIDANIRIRSPNARYSIRNTYIPCHSDNLAPKGCRQYFMEPEGRVTSFNYIANATTTEQTNNLAYSVCIKAGDGLSKIQWSECPGTTFFISGGGPMIGPLSSPFCTRDWVQVYGRDRYCGKGFITVTSMSKPFLLDVHFDEHEGFGVTLPTDPAQCNGNIIEDPYTGGFFNCTANPMPSTDCTCEFFPPPGDQFDQTNDVDMDNIGFCLDYVQM